MRFSLALFSSLLATTAFALPTPDATPDAIAEAEPAPVAAGLTDAQIIKSTALTWAADVALVSGFLDLVAAKKFKSQIAYQIAAKAAYSAEAEQWALKEVLAQELINSPGCKASNSTLADGSWDSVKNLLYELTQLNWKTDQAQIQDLVNKINFGYDNIGGRCSKVLPAIDVYFAAADAALRSYTPKDNTLRLLRTYKPKACRSSKERDLEAMEELMAEDME